MVEKIKSFTVIFESEKSLDVKKGFFTDLINEISGNLTTIEFAQLKGLNNRLSRLINLKINSDIKSTDSEEKWFKDWLKFTSGLDKYD